MNDQHTEHVDAKEGPEHRFVSYLEGLVSREDRGALAALRRSVGKEAPPAEALRYLVPWLPQQDRQEWQRRTYMLVAGLFATHPDPGGRGDLGKTCRLMRGNESAEKRFAALLDSDRDDLPHRLRQVISLAKSNSVPVDWAQLLHDLLRWDHPKRYVQYKWARSFWAAERKDTNDTRAAEETAAVEEG